MIKEFNYPNYSELGRQGDLRVFELKRMPFSCKRVFSVVNAFAGAVRGQHAHRICNQLICCVAGEVELICDDTKNKVSKLLNPSSPAFLVPSGIWAEQYYRHDNTVIMVFCDQPYDEADYIRNYNDFIEWKGICK